jgi:2-amino-4-hydroxy-6-hydroxymethyldihydropteridine diphosphokinase
MEEWGNVGMMGKRLPASLFLSVFGPFIFPLFHYSIIPYFVVLNMLLAYIGIGSNLGDKGRNCDQALELLGGVPGCRLADRSQWFLTRPVGVNNQDWYLNGVACLETETAGHEILTRLLAIESAMGRVRNEKWGPRIIDLDLLLLGREIIKSSDLQVPHPLMHTRRFVLVPMVQIAPALIHPVLGRTMQDLLESLAEDGQEVMALEAFGG